MATRIQAMFGAIEALASENKGLVDKGLACQKANEILQSNKSDQSYYWGEVVGVLDCLGFIETKTATGVKLTAVFLDRKKAEKIANAKKALKDAIEMGAPKAKAIEKIAKKFGLDVKEIDG